MQEILLDERVIVQDGFRAFEQHIFEQPRASSERADRCSIRDCLSPYRFRGTSR